MCSNTMASTQSEPRYLNYNDYKILKIKFNPDRKTDFNEKKFEKILNNTLGNHEKGKYSDVLKEIFRHIYNYNVFMSFRATKPCMYISYILPKVVENKGGIKYNQDTFNTTKRFVEEFKKEERYINEGCESKMVYIDSNIYEKMKCLYDLYDKYYEYKNHFFGNNYAKKCETLGYAMQYHNKIINDYQKDEDLVKQSLEMKRLIEKLELQPTHQCRYYKSELKKSDLELAEEEKEKQRQAEEAKRALMKQQEEREREREREQEREQLKSLLSSKGDVSDTLSVLGTRENDVLSSVLHAREDGLSENSISSRRQQHLEGIKLIDSETHLLNQLGGQKGELDQLYVKNHELESNHISQTDTPGAFESLQNTISGFIKDVDPGPVLGVSGGMGVLFLLFKYTPVGSFFGGRRGRFRQIPRTFGGFPPGDFGYFQEYGGGYVGYSQMDMPFQGE